MAASLSSYVLLGLPSGAERSAIDAAYRALMKRHHPDRGGDAALAAEINRAYADLTRPPQSAPPEPAGDLATALYARQRAAAAARRERRTARKWPVWLAVIALAGSIGWTQREALADVAWQAKWRYFQPVAPPSGRANSVAPALDTPAELVSAPIAAADIRVAITDARSGLQRGGLGLAADDSARCYRRLASTPSLGAYDRCVAFDDAILLLAGPGAVDRGVFSAAALTARQLAAGRSLDADYDAIEDRLDRVRQRTLRELQPATR